MPFAIPPIFYTLARYGIAGVTAAAIDVGVLYALTQYAHMYYLWSAVVAYTLSFFARFFLQKYFTFRVASKEKVVFEFGSYAVLSGWSIVASIFLLKVLVGSFGMTPVPAQVVVTLTIAVASFFVYRLIIFKKPEVKTNE